LADDFPDALSYAGRLEAEVGERGELARRFATRLAETTAMALAARGRCVVGVAGGSVAEAFFPLLVELDLAALDLCWLDERAVAPESPDSNYRLARALWLDRAARPPARVHRLRGEASDLDAEARRAEAELVAALGEPPRIDLALAGVGEDGHVASLFPGRPELGERDRWIVAVDGAPKPPPRRLSMTLRAFEVTDLLVVVAFGAGKADAIRSLLEERRPTSPLALAIGAARRTLLLLDPAAAL